jgi:GntR family transcriptional regulator/MocR family aminotransferase
VVIPLERGPGAPPVHRQLVGYLRRAVESGRIPPGARLPPIRDLAEQLGVHRETIAGAYRELAALGLAESGIGRGTFVRATVRRSGEQTGEPSDPPQFASMLSRGAAATAALPLVDYTAPPDAVRLERLVPDPALYPVDDYRRVIERVLRDEGDALLDYGDPRGHEGLRRVLVERLARIGIETDPDTLVVTGGSTQALALAIRAFCDPGDTVAVESPTYPGLLATLAALGLRTVAVPLAADGVDLDTLDATLARGGIRLICTMPTFHNPTGLTTDLDHRRRLLSIATRHGIPVLEDDFQQDLRVRGRAAPPLRALDTSGQVVHVGTFSKALFPGPRVGWLVAPPSVARAATALKRAMDLASSPLAQAALARFCRTGAYETHLRRAARELMVRHARATTALERHLPRGSTFTRPEGGLAVWVTLPDTVDTLALLPEAKRRGVVYAPGTLFHADGRRSSSLRLTVGAAAPDALERGIRALGDAARDAVPRRRAGRPAVERVAIHV